ncbi:GntR family transcriptional regulator [Azospirillum sp. ST 5-10]|uniref:GntR family transcriptional regulator n=1 Tax=unclassified Azospirillum TaxID=2630922 RepID=UPI003F4A626D
MPRARNTEPSVVAQLHERIGEQIRHQGLRPGDRLPTEGQFAASFGVSRPALREALKLLEQEGIIYAVHGKGRFVSAMAAVRVERPITCFESITRMVERYGYQPANKVLSIAEEAPPAAVAKALQLAPQDRVIRLERLRMHRNDVILYCVDFVPRGLVPDRLYDVDWGGSLVALLEGYGHGPCMSRATVSSVMLPAEVAERNDLHDFGPALLITEVAFSALGRPVIYALDYHRGSAFSFNFVRR